MTAVEPPATALSRWRPSPPRAVALLVGLWLFGTGEGLLVASRLGNSPWTVFAQGAADRLGVSVGTMTITVGVVVLLAWIPLRQRPGLGTICNVVLIGVAIDATLGLLPVLHAPAVRGVAMLGGIATVAVGSGFYLGSALGPGPRDGLMTGLHRVTGRSLALVRASIEVTVCLTGILLGGTAGLGTVLFALLIGPGVQLAVRVLSRTPLTEL